MRTRIVRIGNSQGIRIPKPLIQEAGLQEDVEIVAKGNTLVIRRADPPRAGWADTFRRMAEQGDDALILEGGAPAPGSWDESEWEW